MSDKTHLISFFLFLDYGYAAYLKWSPVPSGKLLLVNKRNRTCRMHLLHLRSVKWGPLLELAQNFHFSENAEFSVNWLVSSVNP